MCSMCPTQSSFQSTQSVTQIRKALPVDSAIEYIATLHTQALWQGMLVVVAMRNPPCFTGE